MNRRLSLQAGVAAGCLGALLLAGCATPAPTAQGLEPHWSGRLAVQVDGEPRQSFSAGFDLRGSARAGELELRGPLGQTVARLRWNAQGARLQAPGHGEREAATLDDLIVQVVGTSVPVAALFDWLAGRPTAVDGWRADLSRQSSGRLQARREAPPATDLRLVLEQP